MLAVGREGEMAALDTVSALGRTVLFHGLGTAELKRLAGITRVTSLPAGAVLFNQGDGSDGLYVITSGIVRGYPSSRHRREATIKPAQEGGGIGGMAPPPGP